jgi:hypothetical protein
MIVAPDAQHHRRGFMSVLVHAFVYAPECGIYDRHDSVPELAVGSKIPPSPAYSVFAKAMTGQNGGQEVPFMPVL